MCGGTVCIGKPDDKKESQEESKNGPVLLRMGIFFDGTLNSIANIDERKDFESFKENQKNPSRATRKSIRKRSKLIKGNDSYTNEYSNVARFYKCFNEKKDEFIIPVYVEGIGAKPREIGKTIEDKAFAQVPIKDKKKEPYKESCKKYDNGEISLDQFIENNDGFVSCSDHQLGSALGIGLFGVKKKVEAACEKIHKEIRSLIPKKKIKAGTDINIELYVFGFSRGSAAARCFCACLQNKVGSTKEEYSSNAFILGAKNRVTFNFVDANIKKKLSQENKYKTSLVENWLQNISDKCSVNLKPNVKFLGLYDTVSSYGANFDDDVDELGLNKIGNVDKVFQICAGDEYRANFNLTDISSTGDKGKYIIIPGAHSDVGGGYAHNIKEKKTGWFNLRAGNKPIRILEKEGWFNSDESERTVSNLYSIIPFLLMKDEIVDIGVVFNDNKFKEYQLPSEKTKIDKIEHNYSKELCDFYNKITSYHYAIEDTGKGKTINLVSIDGKKLTEDESKKYYALLDEEDELTVKISDLNSQIRDLELRLSTIQQQYMDIGLYTFPTYIRMENEIREEITEREGLLSSKKARLQEIKKEKAQYDNDQLLKNIRHDFLHLSVSRGDPLDLIVNKANNNRNKRTVYPG